MQAPLNASRQLTLCSFRGWPAIRLQQKNLMLHVVPQIGGRLMGMSLGEDDVCFVHPDLAGTLPSPDGSNWRELCGDWDFPLWGGGKTWVAPETLWPGGVPHPDLDSGSYTLTRTWIDARSMGVEMESTICRLSDLQIRRRIELFRGTRGWRVSATVTNRGMVPCQCGVWDVLMLNRSGTAHIPLPPTQANSRDLVHPMPGKGPLADLYEAGVIAIQHGALNVTCAEPVEFKVGADSENGEVRVRFKNTRVPLLYQRRTTSAGGQRFAHGHPIEVFNAPKLPYFEVESHSPLATLAPGESLQLVIDEKLERASSRLD